jgi:inorganic pyrophosphatase
MLLAAHSSNPISYFSFGFENIFLFRLRVERLEPYKWAITWEWKNAKGAREIVNYAIEKCH